MENELKINDVERNDEIIEMFEIPSNGAKVYL